MKSNIFNTEITYSYYDKSDGKTLLEEKKRSDAREIIKRNKSPISFLINVNKV